MTKLKREFKSEACGATVEGVFPTVQGHVLLKLKGNVDRMKAVESIDPVVTSIRKVATKERRVIEEVWDLDALVEQCKVEDAVVKILGHSMQRPEFWLLKANKRQPKAVLLDF